MTQRYQGLTIAEIVVSLGILGIIITTTILLFTSLVTGATKNSSKAAAQTFATQILEKSIQEGTFLTNQNNEIYTTDPVTRTRYAYKIVVDVLPGDEDKAYLGGYHVSLEAYWNRDNPEQLKINEGLCSVKATRFVYTRSLAKP